MTSSMQTHKKRTTLVIYLALFFMALILVFVIVSNRSQDTARDSTANPQNTSQPERALEARPSPMPTTTSDPTTATANVAPPPAPAQADPFKVFLETHKTTQPAPVNTQPAPITPQAIQDKFKEALKNQQAVSRASPFSATPSPDAKDSKK